MSPQEREQFYDREIAPVLLELSRKCQENGISIAAQVEWEAGETGTTAALVQEAGVGIRIAHLAMQAHGNVDSLIMALMRYGREHGHNSACLAMLERS
jgi:hypothetical protein